MSTKTTLKRIALVAVSALGFGVVTTVAPANGALTGMTVNTNSLTVVTSNADASGSGVFYVDLADDTANGSGTAALSASETLTVTVTGKPAFRKDGTTASTFDDIGIQAIKTSNFGTSFVDTCDTAATGENSVTGSTCASSNWNATAASVGDGRYWFALYAAQAGAIDAGTYTVRVRLSDSTGFVLGSSNISVRFVSAAADSGAKISISQTGVARTGSALAWTAGNRISVTLKDANDGRLQIGAAATANLNTRDPQLSVALLSSASADTSEANLLISDNGVTGEDFVNPGTDATVNSRAAARNTADGTYGVHDTSLTGTAATVSSVRVRYGSTSVTQPITILGSAASADATKTDLTLTAAGLKIGEELTKSNVGASTTYTLPTTTTSATLRVNIDDSDNAAVPNQQMRVQRTWTGNYVSANVTPASQSAPTTEVTDASGNIDIAISNTTPLDAATLTVTVTGFSDGSSETIVINWSAPAVDSIEVVDPVANVRALAGSTNVFTVIVKDQFGNPMSGELVQPSITGTDDNNYSATRTYATITTGTAGTATWSLTDAAAKAGSDTVQFKTINNSKTTSYTMTYVATLPVVGTLRVFFNRDAGVAQSTASTWTLVPSTGIYAADGTTNRFTTTIGRNYSRSLAQAVGNSTTDDINVFRVECLTAAGASATGAKITVTAGAGGYLVGADNLSTTSRTLACVGGNAYFIGGATGTGAVTFTVTAGSVSATASQWMANANSDARYVTVTPSATSASSNGDAVPVTVRVTDRFGNAVGNVALTLTASGVGVFSGGATTMTYTTDSTGTYTFQATSLASAGGTGTFSATVTTSSDVESAAGRVSSGASVDSTLTAGVKTASASITFAAGKDSATVAAEAATAAAKDAIAAAKAAQEAAVAAAEKAAKEAVAAAEKAAKEAVAAAKAAQEAAVAEAQASADAAAEAIDAANAATDAANLAAEAADAATVAAEEARDAADASTAAVEELSTQVATLMAALKAQITTLANTVAKIAKKVRA